MELTKILQNVPRGTRLYSPAYGDVTLIDYDKHTIQVKDTRGFSHVLDNEGRISNIGETILFPRKHMRDVKHDWEALSWTKGMVLYDDTNERFAMFDHWNDDNYSYFVAQYSCDDNFGDWKQGEHLLRVNYYGNLEEEYTPRFIMECEDYNCGNITFDYEAHEFVPCEEDPKPSETKDDADTDKAATDIPCPFFKTFDHVLVRNSIDEVWEPRHYGYSCGPLCITTEGKDYEYCIPYEGNEKLAYTNESPKL